jgi:amylosucrase
MAMIRPGAVPMDQLATIVDDLALQARTRLGPSDGETFLGRVKPRLENLYETLEGLYGDRTDIVELVESLVGVALQAAETRPRPLRELDRAREQNPRWFLTSSMIGYVCYADRFADDLQGVRARLDYLRELGTTYLHLMPVLAAREGENDGGYAVRDFDSVQPALGTMADLSELAADLHERGMSLCIDLVLNHTAREHEWAQRAMAGEEEYRGYYLWFPDRTTPDDYEKTLPDIFPVMAPGNFTYVPQLDGWVWTTFRDFQWDLNYANPAVLRAMLATMLRLANRGADVLRVDAAPFLWKRLGTNCQDLPETHLLLQALSSLTDMAAPGLLLKAEAMLAPDLLGKYLGDHEPYRPECDLAYDNQLMVMLWSGAATGSMRLAGQALSRRRAAPGQTTWVTYVRCHDDIGWAVADADAAAVGLDGGEHRRFLSDFYAGRVPGSFARGARFQGSPVGEFPTSGTAASLCGIGAALAGADPAARARDLELGLRRLETLYSVVFSFGGIPLVYMGDEIAMLNDPNWADDPDHADDNRWMHRPRMDWAAAEHRAETVGGRAFERLVALARARRERPELGAGPARVLAGTNPSVFAYARGAAGTFVALANFADSDQTVALADLVPAGLETPRHLHSTTGRLEQTGDGVVVPACGFVWLTDE